MFTENTVLASLERYNVIWDTPSSDSLGSMPVGNGDIGLNLWVEQDGDLLFYIGKTDAWDENARLLKLGRIRLRFFPNPFVKGEPFLQVLNLGECKIEVRAGKPEIRIKVWVDANYPVIRVETESDEKFGIQVSLESWRDKVRNLTGIELGSAYGIIDSRENVVEYPDTIIGADDRILWLHRNEHTIWPENMALQGLNGLKGQLSDPLLNRTFGGIIKGSELISVNEKSLKSKDTVNHSVISVYLLTDQTPTIDEWVRKLEQNILFVEGIDIKSADRAHIKRWQEFWGRSWIFASGMDNAKVVTRGYILQRFINACGGRGNYPIKFNGSIFNVDGYESNENKMLNADYRRWGGPYWFQNTRLTYWPMLASGDFDLMRPYFNMYLEALPLARARTALYFEHEGVFFPETMYMWGTYTNDNYGWERAGKSVNEVDNVYIKYYWQGALELTAMMLDYFSFTRDREFTKTVLLPLARSIVQFYDNHYPRDEMGKIKFQPAQALETWWEVVNPLPEIAGMQVVLNGLLSLPCDLITGNELEQWGRLVKELPLLPLKEDEGRTALLPAEHVPGPMRNWENPELYAIFPYRLYGIDKPGLETGRVTFENRKNKDQGGWQQDAIQAAYLGITDTAQKSVIHNFSPSDNGLRFTAFWGPNYDWIPDQDHGGVASKALQAMLMQSEGEKIILFPAWPWEWDVEFKLHAPMNTTVEGIYMKGSLLQLKVVPETRLKDVVIMDSRISVK